MTDPRGGEIRSPTSHQRWDSMMPVFMMSILLGLSLLQIGQKQENRLAIVGFIVVVRLNLRIVS
jgi:hypothetical protein